MTFEGCEWDATKSERCLAERGFDFAFAVRLFDESEYWEEPSQQRHREPRFIAAGRVDGLLLTVVWTPRGNRRRIISARRASKKERQAYEQILESAR
jgi:uncharacterized DUF497 family protein